MRTTLYLLPFQGVVPSQHSSILGVECRILLWPDCTLSGGATQSIAIPPESVGRSEGGPGS